MTFARDHLPAGLYTQIEVSPRADGSPGVLGEDPLNEQLQAWLGEKNAADKLTQSVPHNVTSEMGLAIFDVADVIRPHPEVGQHIDQPVNPRVG